MAHGEKDRIEPRTRAMVRATIRDSMGSRDVCVIDLSTRGILATAARPPRRGDIIEINVGVNQLTGQVAWASERRFGVALRERVSVMALAEGGKNKAELRRSVGAKPRRMGMFAALKANPDALGKLGQLATFGAVAGAAGWVIIGLLGDTLAPVSEAVAVMN